MNVKIFVAGSEATDAAVLEQTRITYDSTRRITTASITVAGPAPGLDARYDFAYYDDDLYAVDIHELAPVTILDGRDDSKLFEGFIYGIGMAQTDAVELQVMYQCDLLDYGAFLDRAVAWDDSFALPMPASDGVIIRALVAEFAPQIGTAHVVDTLPAIQRFEWVGKTLRQILDDLAALSLAEWHVDFDAQLWYGILDDAPPAPYALSTSPDFATSFPVKVEGFKRDFTNPINSAYIRGATDPATGIRAQASYRDPVSIGRYGEFQYGEIDEQLMDSLDAELRAKTTVLRNAYPVEQGSFTVWSDDLKVGQRVTITEDSLGIDGDYIIRSLALAWKSKDIVEYKAQFGAAQPDLESYLRILDQRSRWKSINPLSAAGVAPGSVTDASIAPGGLHAQSIASVNANTILGEISAGQIGSINASAIVGQITAGQIGSVDAHSIQGSIQAGQIGSVGATTIQGAIAAGQIGSVNATTIQGVIVTSQLANQIIDDLAKYADALRPVRIVKTSDPWPPTMPNDMYPANSYFWYEPNGRFYQVTPDGLAWTDQGTDPDTLTGSMNFYTIGRLSAKNITGLIVAAQIQSITATQITGSIQAAQIGTITAGQITGTLTASQIASVNASTIQGTITASQIASVNATAIAGVITAAQIQSVNATSISGTITSGQIGSINAATITIGLISDGQIGTISGSKLIVGTVDSDKLNATAINVGGGGSKPGAIKVYNSTPALVAEIGLLTGGAYGGWFKVFGGGGTGYADAKVKTDTAGNLTITDAAFTVNSGVNNISTSTTTFDATYSTLALINTGSPDKASFISRGLVIYYNNTKIASLVRSPSGGYGELALEGGTYILLTAATGKVRADGGFSVGSNAGQGATVNFIDGGSATFTGGILTATAAASITKITQQLNLAKYPSGYYECYFNNGILSGVIAH